MSIGIPEHLEETPTELRLRKAEEELKELHAVVQLGQRQLIDVRGENEQLKRRLDWAYGIIENLSIGIRNGAGQ